MKELKNEIIEIDSSVTPAPDVKLRSITGMFQTVSAAPTTAPTSFQNQIQIYKNGATKRLYWYDQTNNEWSYTAGT